MAIATIVIPVRNGGRHLNACVRAIQGDHRSAEFEIIVVDDGSPVPVQLANQQENVRLLRLDSNVGPGLARNAGVEASNSELIVFVDADVVVHQDAVSRMLDVLEQDAELAAVFGSYDETPESRQFLSTYRNLHHHFMHQTSDSECSTFWAGFGAVRCSAFLEVNGFSQDYRRPCIEDIEFGHRLTQAGFRIRLVPNLQATHLKRWTFWSMLRCDIADRAVPWSSLIARNREKIPNTLNLSWSQRLAAVLACVCMSCPVIASAMAMTLAPVAWWLGVGLVIQLLDSHTHRRLLGALSGMAVAVCLSMSLFATVSVNAPVGSVMATCLMGMLLINRQLYGLLIRVRGVPFAIYCIPIQLVNYGAAVLTFGFVTLYFKVLQFCQSPVRFAPWRASHQTRGGGDARGFANVVASDLHAQDVLHAQTPHEQGTGEYEYPLRNPDSTHRRTSLFTTKLGSLLFFAFIVVTYITLFLACDQLAGPTWADEDEFLATSQDFSTQLLPTLTQLKSYEELNTPLAFIMFGQVQYLFNGGLRECRMLCFALSICIAVLVGRPRRENGWGPALALIGLFLCPYYLWISTRMYTDIIAAFFGVVGWMLHRRQHHILAAISFALAISTRQYMLAIPLAVAASEALDAIQRRRFPGAACWLPAFSTLTLFGWILVFDGLAPPAAYQARPVPDVQQTLWTFSPSNGIYALATIGLYFVIPEWCLYRRSRLHEDPSLGQRIAVVTLVGIVCLLFPMEGPTKGGLTKLIEATDSPGISGQLVVALLACLVAWRFAKPGASSFLVLFHAMLMMKAFPWDKYVLPVVIVLWYARANLPGNPRWGTGIELPLSLTRSRTESNAGPTTNSHPPTSQKERPPCQASV